MREETELGTKDHTLDYIISMFDGLMVFFKSQPCSAFMQHGSMTGARVVHDGFDFIYLWFYVTFNTVQVKSRWVVGRAEETSTVRQGSVLSTADQWQATTSFPT